MFPELTPRLDAKISSIEENFEQGAALFAVDAILRAAALYWVGLDEDDFCVQGFAGDVAVFGGTNRLIWTPYTGFTPDRSYCTERFLANYERLGRHPLATFTAS